MCHRRAHELNAQALRNRQEGTNDYEPAQRAVYRHAIHREVGSRSGDCDSAFTKPFLEPFAQHHRLIMLLIPGAKKQSHRTALSFFRDFLDQCR